LLSFVRQKEDEVVESVDIVVFVAVACTVEGDELLCEEFDGWSDNISKLDVFAGVLDGALNFVH